MPSPPLNPPTPPTHNTQRTKPCPPLPSTHPPHQRTTHNAQHNPQVQLGLKYGAEPHEIPALLAAAKRLGLRVTGVSFHVGSGVRNYGTYSEAVRRARAAFDAAAALGFDEMALLDLGGGFVAPFAAAPAAAFVAAASAINGALEAYFPADEWPRLKIISEPGRYFAESAATLVSPVYSIRLRTADAGAEVARRDYWLTDGLYGSFNCMLYDDQHPTPAVLRSPALPAVGAAAEAATFVSAVWGPTCDSADCLYKAAQLPELRVGDCLLFSNAGAYTVAGAWCVLCWLLVGLLVGLGS